MLVLTRRSGESIVIGNDIVVTVLEVRHDQVRIGIDAPRSVQVHREEVFNQVLRENTAAVASAADKASPLLRKALPPKPAGQAPPRRGPRLEAKRAYPTPPPSPQAPPAPDGAAAQAPDGQPLPPGSAAAPEDTPSATD